jgi:prepilin-type N-terminal cleavage/methylation domain-containing protein
MNRLARDESGFTLIELVVVMTVLVLVMAGVSSLFLSGLHTSSTTSDILASQTQIHLSLDRLEYETRCASQATRVQSGAGVTLTLPSQCPHATGTITWCVKSGSLVRYAGSASDCATVTGQALATSITSATPFTCISTVGDYPELQVALTARTQSSNDTVSATDKIAMRNTSLVTSTSSACT